MSQPGSGVAAPARDDRELARAFQGLAAYRDQVHRQRESRAATMATDLVADLARAVVDQPDIVASDAVCERLGALLAGDAGSPLDVRVSPDDLAEATLAAADASVVAALTATTEQADAWRGPWRVLTALPAVLPYPFPDAVDATITRLRALPTGRVLPTVPKGPQMTGPALWTSDRYGSRFAVTAPIMTAEEPVRWYLWDIDACGHEALTVHSGYYPSCAAAFTSWQTAVGQTASAGTVLAPVDNPRLLADLLPAEMGFLRPGGENVEQFTEYHRSKRRGLPHVLPAPGRPVRAAHAQLLPRRLRRPAGGAAARLDPMTDHTNLHHARAGRPLPALRLRPTTSAARQRRHESRLPRTRQRIGSTGSGKSTTCDTRVPETIHSHELLLRGHFPKVRSPLI